MEERRRNLKIDRSRTFCLPSHKLEHDQMDKGEKREEEQPVPPDVNRRKEKFVIKIPSYEEVLESSQSTTTTTSASSLFEPSTSFSQAFSFIKKSDFYSPPPPPPEQPVPPQHPSSASTSSQSAPPPRQIGQSEVAPVVSSRNAILVSHRQKGNPLLKHIRNVRWSFAEIVCDYLIGNNSCALYLSLRYHLLHPDYLYFRIRELQKNFKLRVVLCHVDVEDVVKPLLEVTKTALLHDCTLLCAWSLEECGRYLETIKVYENKPADLIQGQMDSDYLSRLNHALTTVRHVNKTDVVTLGSTFGSLANIMDGSMEDLARCPGIGERKVKRLYDTFHEPFKRVAVNQPSKSQTNSQVSADTTCVTEANEDTQNEEDKNKGKKATEVNVRSALSVAFAKYSDRIDRTKKSRKNGDEDTASVASKEKS